MRAGWGAVLMSPFEGGESSVEYSIVTGETLMTLVVVLATSNGIVDDRYLYNVKFIRTCNFSLEGRIT